ncbi:MAG: hypothetical protein WAO83_15320 [Fuerstiella sp.]
MKPLRSQIRICLICITVTCVAVGCGGNSGPARMPINGTVTATAITEKLNGTIAVLPAGSTKGPAANGTINDGLYHFSSDNGPTVGTHHVIIDIEPPRGKMDNSAAAKVQWKFEFDIDVPESPPFLFDFELIRDTE